MKHSINILVFLFLPLLATTQCYPNLKARGQSLYAQQQYDEAIRHYLGALNCPDRPSPQQDEVPDLIKAALHARVDQLNAALDQVEEERLKTEEALAQANKLIDAFYFYADRFALAFKDNRFYYIDKNGDPIEKLGRWESAEQFDWATNFARVKRNDQLILLDTFGNTYPLATEVEQLRDEITALDLSGKGLDSIPKEVWDHPKLEVLLVSSNGLRSLSPEIGQLKQLQTLFFNSNQLSSLPAEIGQLQQLTRLDLSFNRLRSLPSEIGQLEQLYYLKLSQNQLSSLPAEIGHLNQLSYLYLNNNQLASLPSTIGQLKQLRSLDLNRNQLSQLPPEFGQLKQLARLHLNGNQIRSLPHEIKQLQQLAHLYLSGNQLSSLLPEIGQLQQLLYLELNGNQLSSLPPEIRQLNQLAYLYLNNNQLKSLISGIGQLEKLRSLALNDNQLSRLPAEIGQLNQLAYLYLNSNQLVSLPSTIGQLKQLRSLDLNRNQLSRMPEGFSNLTNLQFLDLKETDFTKEQINQLEQKMPWCVIYFRPISAERYFAGENYENALFAQQQVAESSENYSDYWGLSWYALFAHEYEMAIESAQKTLELNPDAQAVETNLALAYLLNDQWSQAEAIYRKWKGKKFTDLPNQIAAEVFLQDIAALEAAGITHPDFEKVRQLLAEDD